MREVRVESVEDVDVSDGATRLAVNGGELALVFPDRVWEALLGRSRREDGPTAAEVRELDRMRYSLARHAADNAFGIRIEGVSCGRTALEYDLVLRSSDLYAATTGYLFAPVVGAGVVEEVGAGLADDGFVEQAYVVGALASDRALRVGDEAVKALSVRGRRCGASRFEMPPELWRVLSEGLGWSDVQVV